MNRRTASRLVVSRTRASTIVYSDSPFVAHLAFLWIANTFDISVQMIDRGMSADSRLAAMEPFVTVPLDRLRRELDRPAEPPAPRVLVTTVGIIAEGLNLTRANYLVLLGPLGTVAKQLQVGCRINREGGFSTPHLTLLLDPDNKAEMVVRWRQLNRAAIETEVWGAHWPWRLRQPPSHSCATTQIRHQSLGHPEN